MPEARSGFLTDKEAGVRAGFFYAHKFPPSA
jgi:hypothetical protein